MATERLRVILDMETGQYRREAKRAADATKEIGSSVDRTRGRLGELSRTAKGAALAIGGAALGAAISDSVRAATDLGESINAVEKVFGSASDEIVAFGEISAQVAGLSQSEFQSLAVGTGSLLQNFGFQAKAAAQEATQLTVRAADMASVFNTDVDQALNAINAGLRGETEPLRKFGVSLSDAAIRARAVELGLADTTAAVDANGKAVAALDLIYEQTAKTQGDFAATSGDLANAQRIMAAEFENAKARLGQGLTPILASAAGAVGDLLLSFQALNGDGATAQAARLSLRFSEAVDNINEAVRESRDPLTALADGLLHIAIEGELTEAQFSALAAAAGLSRDKFDDFARIVVEQGEAMGLSTELIEELKTAIIGVEDSAPGAANQLGNLGDEADTAAKETDRLKDSTVSLASELRKQADPIFRAVSAFQDYQEVLKRIDEDGERTNEELLDLAASVLDSEEALSELGGGNLDRGIEAIAAALRLTTDEVQDLLRELGILDGTNFTVTATVVTRTQALAASGDVDPSIAAAVARAGGRAGGGYMDAGVPYFTGERGIELVVPNVPSYVIPNHQLAGMTGQQPTPIVLNNYFTLDASRADFADEAIRIIDRKLDRYRSVTI